MLLAQGAHIEKEDPWSLQAPSLADDTKKIKSIRPKLPHLSLLFLDIPYHFELMSSLIYAFSFLSHRKKVPPV